MCKPKLDDQRGTICIEPAFVAEVAVSCQGIRSSVLQPPAWDDRGRRVLVHGLFAGLAQAIFDDLKHQRMEAERRAEVEFDGFEFGGGFVAEAFEVSRDV